MAIWNVKQTNKRKSIVCCLMYTGAIYRVPVPDICLPKNNYSVPAVD